MSLQYDYRDLGFDEHLNRGYSPDPSSSENGNIGNAGFEFVGLGDAYGAATTPDLISGATQPNTITSADAGGRISFVPNGYLQSSNFVTGSAGWRIDGEGNAEFNAGTFRGALVANSIDIPDATSANSFHVDNQGNTWWGASVASGLANAPASVTNAGVGTFTNVTVNGSALSNEPIYGSGVDGDVSVAGGLVLARDMFYNDLTITATGDLDPAGFRVFVRGTLTMAAGGFIRGNGNAGGAGGNAAGTPGGAAGAAAAALAAGSLAGTVAGQAGSAGGAGGILGVGSPSAAGTVGTAQAKGLGSAGVAGGAGGAGGNGNPTGGGAAGAAGGGGAITGTVFNLPYSVFGAYLMLDWLPGLALAQIASSAGSGSASGGGGGGSNAAPVNGGGGGGGGGSGSPGRLLTIFARTMSGTGTISSNGGAGGNGGNGSNAGGGVGDAGGGGGGGGGGGASGGVVVAVYNSKAAGITIQANGAAGGTGGTGGAGHNLGQNGFNGTAGASGGGGVVIELRN